MATIVFDYPGLSPSFGSFEFKPSVGDEIAVWHNRSKMRFQIARLAWEPTSEGDYTLMVYCDLI